MTPYRERGLNGYEHQLPGPATYPNLVLTHGLTDVDTLWTLVLRCHPGHHPS